MKTSYIRLFCLFVILCLCLSLRPSAQTTVTWYGQTFIIDTLYPPVKGSAGMSSPWEVVYGPDDSLWVTASRDYLVYKIHPGDKGYRVMLNMTSSAYKDFVANGQTPGSGQTTAQVWPQGGLMGLAIHPDFNNGKPWVYIAYVYHLVGCSTCSGSTFGAHCSFNTKISRFSYSKATGTLTYMDDVITGLHGSNDHNSGRLRISPLMEADGKYHLYYTIGDMGAGQLANMCRMELAQDTTIIEGKTLRLNTEPDGTQPAGQQWIPADNPFPSSPGASTRSPIYTFGHRNPQGLVFGSVNGASSYILYSSEHGDRSDDEINVITPHTNYGWPKVSGYCDDNYTSTLNDSLYLAGKAVISETGFCDTTKTTVAGPIFTFHTVSRAMNKTGAGLSSNMGWPTVAPSSIAFYGPGAIPGWSNSLLVPSLKDGLWRLKLNSDGLSVNTTIAPTDSLHYLLGYRLRNVTVSPTGDTLFVAVDNSCCTLGPTGSYGNAVASPALGYILRLVYLTTLALHPDSTRQMPPPTDPVSKVYPNPTHGVLYVEAPSPQRKPWTAQLYSVTGRTLLTKTTGNDRFSLDVSGVQPGVYILRLVSAAGSTVLINKVLIE